MVLGVAWLSTLGEVVMDWKFLTMQFVYGKEVVKLQGMRIKDSKQSNLHAFLSNTQGIKQLEYWGPQL